MRLGQDWDKIMVSEQDRDRFRMGEGFSLDGIMNGSE